MADRFGGGFPLKEDPITRECWKKPHGPECTLHAEGSGSNWKTTGENKKQDELWEPEAETNPPYSSDNDWSMRSVFETYTINTETAFRWQ